MNSYDTDLPRIFLKPGEIHLAKYPSLVTTILGSCLSVIMWHRELQLGVICHGILPQCPNLKTCRPPCNDKFKYVDCAIHWMFGQLTNRGINLREIEVKLFGGGDLFPSPDPTREDFRVGKKNTKTALRILRTKGLSVGSKDLGGLKGRKIIFNTGNGEVLLKHLNQDKGIREE